MVPTRVRIRAECAAMASDGGRRVGVNWAFVPLAILITVRSILEGQWLYGVIVMAVGLGLGLWLRHRGHE